MTEDGIADDFEIEKDDYYGDPDVVDANQPDFGSEEWSDFVLSQLTEDEYVDEDGQIMPCCHGLRRLAEVLLGTISGGVKNIIYPDPDDPRRVVVVYELLVENFDGKTRVFTEVADTSLDNTDAFFLDFAVATASTRAEARALKKALLIKGVTADEVKKGDRKRMLGLDTDSTPVTGTVSSEEPDDDTPISDKQYQFLEVMGKKGDINIVKFVKEQIEDTPLSSLTKSEAKDKLIMPLDAFVNKKEDTPESIKGYNDKWREQVQ